MDDTPERKISGLSVRLERDTCIGSGSCRNVAPEVFELDSRQTVSFTAEPAEIDRERLLEAARVCPVEAILVFGDDGDQLAP